MPNTRHIYRPHSPVPVYPPYPSFAWVINTQANPPSDAYAHGYVENARNRLTKRQTRLPATHHESCRLSPQHTTKPLFPPPPAGGPPIVTHELFMQTIDHRYDDLPTQPFVPWRASLSSYEMQRFRLRPEVPVTIAPPFPPRTKRRRLNWMLRGLRRAFGLSKGSTTRPTGA